MNQSSLDPIDFCLRLNRKVVNVRQSLGFSAQSIRERSATSSFNDFESSCRIGQLSRHQFEMTHICFASLLYILKSPAERLKGGVL
jgi:hypothetical protein